MDRQRFIHCIGKIGVAALLAIVLGTGVSVASPMSDVAPSLSNVLLMEDSGGGGSAGQYKFATATPAAESCGPDSDSAEPTEKPAGDEESG